VTWTQSSARYAITTAKLVVLDPVVAYLSPDKSAYREQHVREALGPVRTTAQATGAAVVVVMHPNKAEGSDPLRRIGNSAAFTALARSVLIFGRDPSVAAVTLDDSAVSAAQADDVTDLRVLAIAKSNLGSNRPALQFRAEEFSFETPDGTARIMRLEELGPSSVSAEELLSDDDPEERSALADAKAWLKDLLADGPVLAKHAEKAAGEAGHAGGRSSAPRAR
jgi:AAA domain